MKIFIASDHAGYDLKEKIKNKNLSEILGDKVEILDFGTNSTDSCDYPIYAKKMIKSFKKFVPFFKTMKQKNFGILICGSGIGMSMVANRFKKIRAVLCRSIKDAELSRQHNNANVICFGARFTDENSAIDMIEKFITSKFEGGRHKRRVKEF